MKIFQNVLLIGFLGVFATGCMYPGGRPDYTGSGALSGAATGAAIGAMASQSGEGALLGGAIGAIAGGLIGHGMDAQCIGLGFFGHVLSLITQPRSWPLFGWPGRLPESCSHDAQ